MKIIKGSISTPQGFKANGVNCGIKKRNKLDLALIYSRKPACAYGMFTTNSIQAAPIKVTMNNLQNYRAQAIIVNSGNANSFTKKIGINHARIITKLVAKEIGINHKDVLVASTGIIGKLLPLDKISKGIPPLVKGLNKKDSRKVAKAIMTTDKFPKELALRIKINGKVVTIAGVAKGAGMIYPNLATMLCFITSDALITPTALRFALRKAVKESFNSISVDGCMSTNDMVLILANGLAQNKCINLKDKNLRIFSSALSYLCLELAKMIILDAEGATKLIKIEVIGTKTIDEARKVAFSIANSNLFKTAAYGEDANWGRIIAAVGASGVRVKADRLDIRFSSFKKREINIRINLKQGLYKTTVYTSDLTPEYIKINAKYN